MSTFQGLEISIRGMYAQQSALYTTGHNISNANTYGYSRQRVNFEQTGPYPPASRNRPQIPGQVGSGVEIGSVQRVRDQFLDEQYRLENSKVGYYHTRSEGLIKMEEVMNEPSDFGLSKTMDEFWKAWQDLANNPEDAGARAQVKQRGIAVAETFNFLYGSLTSIRNDYKNELEVAQNEINSLAKQIHEVNKEISEVEAHGYVPNDLYDERDRLVDKLSDYGNIKVTETQTSDKASAITEGTYTVEFVDAEGNPIFTDAEGNGIPLVDGTNGYNELSINMDGNEDSVRTLELGGSSVQAQHFASEGKLLGLMETYGMDVDGEAVGTYPDMMDELDTMAYTFAKAFNEVHRGGYGLNEIQNGADEEINFFDEPDDVEGFADRIRVSDDIIDDPNNIAAAASMNSGDGGNAQLLADVRNEKLDYDGDGEPDSTFDSYYQGVIGEMGIQSSEAQRLRHNSETLRLSAGTRRQSVSGVSLDEEMSNMIKFQHAYNAAARNLTTIDETLDKIINGMGRVGR
ncbi:flagellar hook-associated protein FlgK [Pontibacillus litoralis]|uniref:Flagellar hook-associated protein 1 n=1 Tax=Pontibacillus litoralis JSM 072002 TaxID=1385512 RepID=A0A0A5G2P6_9BACI|nr:flagellar hook-associated protein FlgK [Pontibacillus litoralis]KGX86314.1 hypothetical protein N784_05030 [Pontibacillus litoralis JSM 072002]